MYEQFKLFLFFKLGFRAHFNDKFIPLCVNKRNHFNPFRSNGTMFKWPDTWPDLEYTRPQENEIFFDPIFPRCIFLFSFL